MGHLNKFAYVTWFREDRWDWICTLTLRKGIGRKTAVKKFHEWIRTIERLERARLSFVYAVECGGFSGGLHFHAVIAGAVTVTPDEAEKIWKRLAGIAQVELYEFDRGGLEYVLKSLEHSDDYHIDHRLFQKYRASQREPRR